MSVKDVLVALVTPSHLEIRRQRMFQHILRHLIYLYSARSSTESPTIVITTMTMSPNNVVTISEDSNPTERSIRIHSGSTGSWIPAIAILDSGADNNWISQEVVERLKMKKTNESFVEVTLGNGDTMRSTGSIETDWGFVQSARLTTRRTTFYVASNPPFDVVIGRKLLIEEGILQINERLLILIKDSAKLSKQDKEKQLEIKKAKAIAESIIRENMEKREAETKQETKQQTEEQTKNLS